MESFGSCQISIENDETSGARGGAAADTAEGVRAAQEDCVAEMMRRPNVLPGSRWRFTDQGGKASVYGAPGRAYSLPADPPRRMALENTFASENGIVARLSKYMTRIDEYREVLFWLLLLGSWQFLASPGTKTAVVGAGGAALFLLFAFRNLGRLTRLGLRYASWRPTNRARWALGVASGLIAGLLIFGIGSATGQSIILSSNWKLALIQITLGPVLEEVVFRGYLFSLLIWALHRTAGEAVLNWLVIVTAAVIFALVHLAQPGVSWLQFFCITMTGGLYGWIRTLSASTAPAAVAHAAYNLTLYGVAGVIENVSL